MNTQDLFLSCLTPSDSENQPPTQSNTLKWKLLWEEHWTQLISNVKPIKRKQTLKPLVHQLIEIIETRIINNTTNTNSSWDDNISCATVLRFFGLKPKTDSNIELRNELIDKLICKWKYQLQIAGVSFDQVDQVKEKLGLLLLSRLSTVSTTQRSYQLPTSEADRGASSSDPEDREITKNCKFCWSPIMQWRKHKNKDGYYFRSKTFCGSACVHCYRISRDASYTRKALLVRDRGVCRICNIETYTVYTKYRKYMRELKERESSSSKWDPTRDDVMTALQKVSPDVWWTEEMATITRLVDTVWKRIQKCRYRELNRGAYPPFGLRQGDLWHADHVVPVSLGGGCAFTILNYRTLCVECHKNVTRILKSSGVTTTSAEQKNTPPEEEEEAGELSPSSVIL